MLRTILFKLVSDRKENSLFHKVVVQTLICCQFDSQWVIVRHANFTLPYSAAFCHNENQLDLVPCRLVEPHDHDKAYEVN